MSSESRPLIPWEEAFGADPFVILGCSLPEGERFLVIPVESSKTTSVQAMGLTISAFVAETELRTQLMQTGLSHSDIEARIELARDWATMVTCTSGARAVNGGE